MICPNPDCKEELDEVFSDSALDVLDCDNPDCEVRRVVVFNK